MAAAESLNAFGFDFYRSALTSGGNAVLSPASIVLALSMARAGAAGETASQMDGVLHSVSVSDLSALRETLNGLSGTFEVWGEELTVTLKIANAVFAQGGYSFEKPFLHTLDSAFGSELRLVDFAADPSGACRKINGWAKRETEGRIPSLLGSIPPFARLILANAIYLKAPWRNTFNVEYTRPAPFTRLDGSTVDVPMMNKHFHGAGYARGAGWEAVELEYAGGSLAMTIVVPADLRAFEAKLDGERFREISTALQVRAVELTMPRFEVASNADLGGTLAAMGMPLAFDADAADFSAMTAEERLFISAVVHQANITVTEAGTEAAAATAVILRAGAAMMEEPPPEMHVDRPFVFAVRDTGSGAILFLGRVVDPSV